MQDFLFTAYASRVRFGIGASRSLVTEQEALVFKQPILLSTPEQEDAARDCLRNAGLSFAAHFANATMHTPTSVTDDAVELFKKSGADGVIAFGGGSTIGLGKAIAHRTGAAHLAIPTTYAGSEMTPILGQTQNGRKATFSDPCLVPNAVVYDPELTIGLPRELSVMSGLNALAHAIEAMYSPGANPVLDLLADEATRAMSKALPKLATGQTGDLSVRSDALYGAWLCSLCLAQGGVALHHKLCHVLGGMFGLPHAQTHSVILPYALTYNAPAIPYVMDRIVRATGSEAPARWMHNLLRETSLPYSLKQLGMPEEGIAQAAKIALESPYPNPRGLERAAIAALLTDAWHGHTPE